VDLTPGRIRTARIVALVADCVQILALPAFSEGALSPVNDVLDVLVGAILIGLLGWHWAFLPAFVSELVPVWDLIPTWSGTVFFVTRGGVEPPTVQPPAGPPALSPPAGPTA
jgi:hypothetical protein